MQKRQDWLKNAVIYQIFIDRFAGYKNSHDWDKPVFIGGNIRGIINKLPYIELLGVNTIWLSPFCKTSAYHGYHIVDFYSVDSNFGSEKDLKKLIDNAHKRGIKIIMDFVPNHCSHKHPYFIDAQKNPKSIYRDWFIFDNWPSDYRCFLSYKELPKLNLDYKPAFKHILGSARKWLSMGVDGLRIDHIIGLSNENTEQLVGALKEEFPNTVYIGEATAMGIKYKELNTLRIPKKRLIFLLKKAGLSRLSVAIMYRNYIGMLDGVLNFLSANELENMVNGKDESRVVEALVKQKQKFQNQLVLPTFLDNHDMERFLFRCGNDVEKLKKALNYNFQ